MELAGSLTLLLHDLAYPYKCALFIVLERLNAADISVTWLNEAISSLLREFMT
jgi:hypothetical protein